MRPHGALPLAKHAPRSGARALDVGCGRGDTTLDLARLVGPNGSAVGLDSCEARIEVARREARIAETRNATFVRGYAHAFQVEEHERFDLLFTRLGRTCLGDPESALRNVRRALKPGGRLLGVTWRAKALNPWASVPIDVVRRHVAQPRVPEAEVRRSGPFSLADADAARALLERAGYLGVTFEAIDAPVVVGATVDEAIARQLHSGPAAELLVAAGSAATAYRDALVADLRSALRAFVTPRGVVMGSSVWCITARNPS